MPLVGDANFGLALKPYIHVDRIAEYHVLIYLLKGRMEIIEDGTTYVLTPGTIFFLKAGVHHWGATEFEAGTAWYYVHFYTSELTTTMKPLTPTFSYATDKCFTPMDYQYYLPLPKYMNLSLGNVLEKELEKLVALTQSVGEVNLMEMNLTLWNVLFRCYELGQGKEEPLENERTRQLIVYLKDHYAEQFTASDLEKEIGLSYKYIGTQFKQRTGMTIRQYQLMLRIQEAAKLLCETELSITEISDRVGFYDSFYFSNIFKREKGMSPKRFRDIYMPSV